MINHYFNVDSIKLQLIFLTCILPFMKLEKINFIKMLFKKFKKYGCSSYNDVERPLPELYEMRPNYHQPYEPAKKVRKRPVGRNIN